MDVPEPEHTIACIRPGVPCEVYEVVKKLIEGSSLPRIKLLSPLKSVNSIPGYRFWSRVVSKSIPSVSASLRLACATPKSLWSIFTMVVW